MSESKNKLSKAETNHRRTVALAEQALRKAQEFAIRKDRRYGLKPVIVKGSERRGNTKPSIHRPPSRKSR